MIEGVKKTKGPLSEKITRSATDEFPVVDRGLLEICEGLAKGLRTDVQGKINGPHPRNMSVIQCLYFTDKPIGEVVNGTFAQAGNGRINLLQNGEYDCWLYSMTGAEIEVGYYHEGLKSEKKFKIHPLEEVYEKKVILDKDGKKTGEENVLVGYRVNEKHRVKALDAFNLLTHHCCNKGRVGECCYPTPPNLKG